MENSTPNEARPSYSHFIHKLLTDSNHSSTTPKPLFLRALQRAHRLIPIPNTLYDY